MHRTDLEGLPGVLYLRKSRKDIEAERDAAAAGRPYDTLEKHQIELFRMVREYKLNVVDVLKEVVSGEFIAERDEFQKVLEYLAGGETRWVGVMDEDRLGRGDKVDQGRIERAFKESEALIITPSKVVDMNNEADEMYMDYKGQGARYEYKQAKKRLHGGRKMSANRGNFVGYKAAYGYLRGIDFKTTYPHLIANYVEKAADMENLKLYPHPDQAAVIKDIFQWYDSGVFISEIINRLKSVPAPSERGWKYNNIHRILKNPVYKGTIRFGNIKHTKLETGKYKTKLVPRDKVQMRQDAHIPIVDAELFDRVQERINNRTNAPVNGKKHMNNPVATLLKCHYCGLAMGFQKYYSKEPNGRRPVVICRNFACSENHSLAFEIVEAEMLRQIETYFKFLQSDPSFIKKVDSSSPSKLFDKRKADIEKRISDSKQQLDTAHELLELKKYTIETFIQRQKAITEKLTAAQNELAELSAEIEQEGKRKLKQTEIIPRIRHVLHAYKNATVKEKNELLVSIIEAMYYDKPGTGYKQNPHFNLRIIWKSI